MIRAIRLLVSATRSNACTRMASTRAEFFIDADPADCLAPEPIRIRNKKYLPGSDDPSMPDALCATEKSYVKVVALRNNASEVDRKSVGEHIRELVEAGALTSHPAILFKGLPFTTANELQEIFKFTGLPVMDYKAGTAYRHRLNDTVYEGSAEDPKYTIEFHNEMSYLTEYPSKLALACMQPAARGGESPITSNKAIHLEIDQKYLDKIKAKKIRYMRNLHCASKSNYITWQNNLETDDKQEAERTLEEKGFGWRWQEDGGLQVWNILPGFRRHPNTGEEIFFNQITSNHGTRHSSHPMFDDDIERELTEYPYHVQYGDGEELEPELLSQNRVASWKHATAFALKTGDLLILDNVLVQHARMSYEGDRLMNAVLLR